MASRLAPRLQLLSPQESLWNRLPPAFLAPALLSTTHSFTSSASQAAKIKKANRHHYRDAYALRQIKLRRDAHLSRQALLKEERAKELGDPIRGVSAPFVESFDWKFSQDVQEDVEKAPLEALKADSNKSPLQPSEAAELDHGIRKEELEKSLNFSRLLMTPIAPTNVNAGDPGLESAKQERQETWHARAAEAVQRIVSLVGGSSKHRTKKNVERIVETLGRHRTDQTLKPKATTTAKRDPFARALEATPRAGPDTGSSEVQIGILTAKIRVLADRYEGENRNDKVNKRNLRLLLHRRQKLLSYMERKERGSQRWFNMLETLGITPACWKGQIAVE